MANIIGMNGGNPQPPKPKVDISQSTPLECSNCGDDTFLPAIKMRKISKLLTGTPMDAVIPIDCFLCANCGELNIELLPEQVRSFYEKKG
jgi:predicted RNA-binding Zn-ribbon protein involved in translation (DUF1610 family)